MGIRRIVISRRPFPSESTFVFEALPQNCLYNLGAADLSTLLSAVKDWFLFVYARRGNTVKVQIEY